MKKITMMLPAALTFVLGTFADVTIGVSARTMEKNGGAASITVSGTGDWTAVSDVKWISIRSGGSGNGAGVVKLAISANTTANTRIGHVNINGNVYTITQMGIVTEKKNVLSGVQTDTVVILDDSKGVWLLTGDYVVPEGCELKIKEGVRLVASKKCAITIQGALDVQGTQEKPVVIKSAISGMGAWEGIKLMRSSAEITYLHISGAKDAIRCEGAELRVWNSTFVRNESVVSSHDGHHVQFENCFVASNKKVFNVHGCNLELDHCSFIGNKDAVMYGSWGGRTACRDCVIEKNGSGFKGASDIEMHGCAIQANGKFDIYNESGTSGDCTGNWWGSQVTTILKKNGGTKQPKVQGNFVNLSGFLTERPEECGAKDYPAEDLK